jgi:hypothetical protein
VTNRQCSGILVRTPIRTDGASTNTSRHRNGSHSSWLPLLFVAAALFDFGRGRPSALAEGCWLCNQVELAEDLGSVL